MSGYTKRLAERKAELTRLYMELYSDSDSLAALLAAVSRYAQARSQELVRLDAKRLKDPHWFLGARMMGMTMYTELFNGTFSGITQKMAHLKNLGLSYLHLMPFTATPLKDNDGGFAVSDFFNADPRLGTNEDVEALADSLRKAGISLCMDFVMNHTSDEHEWAVRAKAGDEQAQAMYLCYPDRTIPDEFEKTMPEVFPETAPGNFIYSPEMGKWVLSTFYPKQWDLNYRNPAVFNAMVEAMLCWANRGVEVFRLDAVPYIWKELGTSCRNLPQVHTIVRMIRLVLEIACPAVILKGEVVMAPRELKAYFGTPEQPECHLLYGVSAMVNIWGALSSMDVRLLYSQIESMLAMGDSAVFVNYLRCHDDIGWGFDEDRERELGIDPLAHKIFQYRFYCGQFPLSYARGELYNYDPDSLDARSCGTTASLVGIEAALESKDLGALEAAVRRYAMLYSLVFALRGFPLVNSGDEVGMLNDCGYKNDPLKAADSRYVHRPRFDWAKAAAAAKHGTLEAVLTGILKMLCKTRTASPFFSADAFVTTWWSHNSRVFALRRSRGGADMLCVFSFSSEREHARFDFFTGIYEDAFTGRIVEPGRGIPLWPYETLWLTKKTE